MEKQSLPNKAKARMLRTLAKLRGSGLLPCHRHDSGASRAAQRPTDGRSQPLNRATNSHCPFHAPTDKKARSLKFRKRRASSLESCGGSCLPIGLASFVVGLLARPSPAPHRLRARIPSSFDESAPQNDLDLGVDRPKIIGSPLGYRPVDCRIQPEKELFALGFSPFADTGSFAGASPLAGACHLGDVSPVAGSSPISEIGPLAMISPLAAHGPLASIDLLAAFDPLPGIGLPVALASLPCPSRTQPLDGLPPSAHLPGPALPPASARPPASDPLTAAARPPSLGGSVPHACSVPPFPGGTALPAHVSDIDALRVEGARIDNGLCPLV